MRLLFDQNVPWPLYRLLPEHKCVSAHQAGWDRLVNGDLITAAESAAFDVLVTLDTDLRYQQNLTSRTIGIVVLPQQRMDVLEAGIEQVRDAIGRAGPGAYIEFDLPRPTLTRRPPPGQKR